jgi:DNA-binding NarL/FixJ family response regulator
MKILLADDQMIIRKLVRKILTTGFPLGEIEEVEDGYELVKRVRGNKWDLVIADIRMPVMNGFEAIREIRRYSAEIPLLVLSCHTGLEYSQLAFKYGASGYIHKYKMHEDLVKTIRGLLPA